MEYVQPIPGEPAAVVDLGTERALAIADYHAGIETALRYERNVELPSAAAHRRRTVYDLLDRTEPDRLVVLGDLTHSIGEPGGAERGEIEVLFEGVSIPVTLVKGNHDGAIEPFLEAGVEAFESVTVTPGSGIRLGEVGFVHGHTWPSSAVLEASVVCIGHEHPCVRLVDEVGGSRLERVWLRGSLAREPFATRYDDLSWRDPELVVFPAFNDRCGGTWINVKGQSFITPFLPDGLDDGEAYLLDGTRLGPYRDV